MNANTFRHRARLWCAIAMALLSCLPVLVAHYPQMSDYPAHLARYHVMLEGGRNPDLARYYGFTWAWTGNLGVNRVFHTATLLPSGNVLVIGGMDGYGAVLASMELYTPSNGTWQPIDATLSTPIFSHAAVLLNRTVSC